jgi:hypothetical protein
MKGTDFENVLIRCLEDMEHSSLEDCLARYPEHADALRPLLRTAMRLKTAPRVLPRPVFKQATLAQVGALAQESWWFVTKRRFYRCVEQVRLKLTQKQGMRRIAWSVATLIFLIAGVGVLRATGKSLPGDALYQVKMTLEHARLTLSFGEENTAKLHLDLAEERLKEAVGLAQSERWDAVRETIARYAGEMDAASSPLETTTNGADLRRSLKMNAPRHLAMIHAIYEMAPEKSEPFTQIAVSATWRGSERAGFAPPSTPSSVDLDGDTVSNVDDDCPYVPGLTTTRGCPESSEERPDDRPTPIVTAESPVKPTETPRSTHVTPRPTDTRPPSKTPGPTEILTTQVPRPTETLSHPTLTPADSDVGKPTETPVGGVLPVVTTPARPTRTPTTSLDDQAQGREGR